MSIDLIVKNHLCSGCGVCVSEDQTHQAKMIWNNEGFLVPLLGKSSTQDKMVKVCPFAIQQKDEDELGELFLKQPETQYHDKIGYYYGLYAGYSKQFRETSSSGGIATYVFNALLERKIVDHLFIVKEVDGQYAYQFFSNVEEITQISKTRYTPVTLEKLFQELSKVDGKVAVSGVACFVKAIRLKQMYDPVLKEKIAFIVGIICGGLKSKYYTDYLAQEAGCKNEYNHAQYRVKNKESHALDYKFSCIEKSDKRIHMVDMQSLGDMWGTGLFKSNACDFCDDVLTELADISLGDAWIKPYRMDGLGNSIIITRTEIAELIVNGNDLVLDSIDENKIIESQSGSFNHRHNGLLYRIKLHKSQGGIVPFKRKRVFKKQIFLLNLIQKNRLLTREKSIYFWMKFNDRQKFNNAINIYLYKLRFVSKWTHRLIRLIQKIKL